MFDDVLYDTMAIDNEIERLLKISDKLSYNEVRKRASRRIRYAVRSVLKGVRPRLKGYSGIDILET
jgi:hypothetical protein